MGGSFRTHSKMVTSCPFHDKVTPIYASWCNVNITENYLPAFNKKFCSQMLEMLVLLEMLLGMPNLRTKAQTLSPTPAWISLNSVVEACSWVVNYFSLPLKLLKFELVCSAHTCNLLQLIVPTHVMNKLIFAFVQTVGLHILARQSCRKSVYIAEPSFYCLY